MSIVTDQQKNIEKKFHLRLDGSLKMVKCTTSQTQKVYLRFE